MSIKITWACKHNYAGPDSHIAYLGKVKVGHIVFALVRANRYNARICIGDPAVVKMDMPSLENAKTWFERALRDRLNEMGLEVRS